MIHNITKKTVIAKNPVAALTMYERGRGMIARDFRDFDAMVFNNCSCIHTMFMSISIDVIFVDKGNQICGLRKNLVPWIPFARAPGASAVVELPVGAIERALCEKGDFLDLNAELTEKAKEALLSKEFATAAHPAMPFKQN
ncbi:MAG TPA: DUF192 domain-containing protein [Lentisphaeria bacterium]|nr:MAG: hypothetical protein A2X45_06215 [Lentisphaerae bacterium GWF2_50_93]HCE44834.1 DUF192 domain-containing protein [Lentisphaeria bacterium]